jgi:hypothetical protein
LAFHSGSGTAAQGDLAGVRLRDRAHTVTDLEEDLARQLDATAAAFSKLDVQIRGGAPAALYDLGEQRPDLVAVREAPGAVERGPADRRQRPPSRYRRRKTVSALGQDQARAGAPAVARDEQMDGSRRLRHSLHPVQFERVEPGEDSALARVEQSGLPSLLAIRWRVVELDDSRQHSPPRSTSPAAISDSAPGETERHHFFDAHDGGSAERGE